MDYVNVTAAFQQILAGWLPLQTQTPYLEAVEHGMFLQTNLARKE